MPKFLKINFQVNLLLLLMLLSFGVVQAQVPDAPTNLVVTPLNTGGMIQFTAPASDGGSAITNYEYSTDNGDTWITPSPAITSSPLIISSGLTNCTSYQVKIRAVNASGSGTASSAATLVPLTSSNPGITWIQRASAAAIAWSGVTYGNGLFVAVARSGTGNRVMTSPDGIAWTSRTSAADNAWKSVTYGNGLFVAVANSGTGNRVMTSPDGMAWTSRTSAADNWWGSVAYGNGLFVAVANTGIGNRVMTSPDGITWTSRNSAADNEWVNVTYGNGLFVAVANTGTGNRVMTSPDGITWTSRNSAADNEWVNVTYGNGLFVAVANTGTGNRVMTSPDGITWTSRTTAADNSWNSVTYGNGLFVAVASTGTGNRVMTSPDGITWTSRTSAADNSWVSVTYGNGLFVAVAESGNGNQVMTSGYGIVADAPVISAINARNNGAQLIFSNTASIFAPPISNYEYSTDDGSTWIARNLASYLSPLTLTITGLSNGTLYNIKLRAINAFGASCASTAVSVTPSLGTVPDAPTNLVVTPIKTGGMIKFTTPANDGGSSITNYEYSINGGSTWNTPSPANPASPLIISSGLTNCTSYQVKIRAVNASGSGTASSAVELIPTTSVMGVNWTARTSAADNNWQSVTYGNGLFVAVASSGFGNRVMTSPDGITWTSRTSAADNSWNSVTYGNGLFVAVASSGIGNRVMTSPDGITWTSRTSAADNSWNSVTYGNGLFVAVAISGIGNRVMTSPDGITWTSRTSAADNTWNSVTYGNGKFVAMSDYNSGVTITYMTSTNGITWTSGYQLGSWKSVTYGNGLFVVVAISTLRTRNGVLTSQNGTSWTTGNSAETNSWNSVTYGNGLFVSVASTGNGNRVMTSPDGTTWTTRTSAANNSWNSVTYANGIFVAVASTGTGNRVMTSSYSPSANAPVINNISPRNNGASVAFTQTASANAPAVSNYEYSTDNGSTWTARNPASNLSPMIIRGLTNDTSYNIKIRAINSVGTSCASSAVSATPALGTVADAPTNLVANPIINSGGVIQFNAPANDGGSDITNYEYSTDNGATWVTPSPAVTVSPLTISSGLTNCISYQIKLRAVNAAGVGAASVMTILASNPTSGGTIAAAQSGSSGFDPDAFTSSAAASGHTGTLEYKWQSSTTSSSGGFSDIASSNADTYDASTLTQTTWFKRLARVSCAADWSGAVESNVLEVTIISCTPNTSTETISACDSYTWHGTLYTSSNNTATWTGTNAGGCDSVVTLNLTINTTPATPSVNVVNNCNGTSTLSTTATGTLLWSTTETASSITVSSAGTYKVTQTINGCTSESGSGVAAPKTSNTGDTTASACGSFVWYGVTYNSSSTPTHTFTNVSGCDSVVTLHLTVGHANTVDTTAFACNSFVWYGVTYNSSSTPTLTFTNVNGCDSVVTLHLTVGHANTGDTTAFACNSFDWYGTTYNSSATPTHILTNVSGCDSVVSLHLTINTVPSVVSTTNANRCGTGSVSLSATPSLGASIRWYALSTNGSLLYTGNTYATPSITSTKTYYAEAFNGLCASSRVAIIATINTAKPATPGNITGLTRQCQYATNQVYSIAPVANASKYKWTLPTGWRFVGDSTSNSVAVNIGGNVNSWDISQALSVAAVNDCGVSANKSISVSIPMSNTTPRTTVGLTNVCSKIGLAQPNDTVRYKVTATAGTAYINHTWLLSDPSTMRIVDASGTDSLWVAVRFTFGSFVSGSVSVSTKTNCGLSAPKTIAVGTSAAGTVTSLKGATNVCSKISSNAMDTFRYTALLSGAIGYKWTISGTSSNLVSIVDAATDSSWIAVHYSTGFASANLNVKAISSCGIRSATAKSIAAGIVAPSAPTSLTGTTNICPILGTQKGYTYTSSSVTGAVAYVWTVPNGAVIDSPAVAPYGTKVKVRFVTAGSKDSIYVQVGNNCTLGAKKVLKLVTTGCVTPVFAKTSAHSESKNESIRLNVFPNPTTSDINVQVKGAINESLITIRVMDLQGRVMKVMNVMPEQNMSVGSDLKAGTYLMEVRQGKNLVTQKVIKY